MNSWKNIYNHKMSEEHSEEDIFLTPEIDPFKDNPILNIKFSVNKGSQTDKKLINYFYSKTIGKKNSDNNVQTLKNYSKWAHEFDQLSSRIVY